MSNFDNAVGSVSRLGNRVSTSIGALDRLSSDLGLSGSQTNPQPFREPQRTNQPFWYQALQPASWRGLQFAVMDSKLSVGRRNVIHEYPYRDAVYVEDLGRQARRITVNGFIVGNDVISRKNQFIAASEKIGDGELILPTLGKLKINLISLEIDEFWDKGRAFFLTFTFVQGEQRIYPVNKDNTLASTSTAVAQAKIEVSKAYQNGLVTALKNGSAVVQKAVNTTTAWARKAQRVVNNARNLYNLAQDIPRDIQRAADDLAAVVGFAKPAIARKNTQTAINNLIASAANLAPTTLSDVPIATDATLQAVITSTTTQDDALTALKSLADFSEPYVPTTAPIGDSLIAAQVQSEKLYRRSALIALCDSTTSYQPKSYDDALLLRQQVIALLDKEILIAADDNDYDVYQSLRKLRQSVITDLTTRGATLKPLITFTSNSPLPACLIAQRLYQDVNRTDDVIQYAKAIHPAFMPQSFKVLSK